jgi:nicotinamidase/pyrazinamidase
VAGSKITLGAADVFLIVDVQNDFLPGGSLAVPQGDAVIPVINRLAPHFPNLVQSQDWHPPRHASFASSHPGKVPFETIALPYGPQVLGPDHCVQNTAGAAFARDIKIQKPDLVLRKGYRQAVDSYSAFIEADGISTGLAGFLKQRKIRRVFIAGLATDFCVAWSAIDARKAEFTVFVIEDACRAIDTNGSLAAAWATMRKAGVKRIKSGDIAVPA